MYSFLKKPLDYYISDSTGVMNLNLYQVKIHSEVDPHTLVVEPFWKNMTLIINETKETVITMKCVDCMGLERKEENVELVIKNALKIQVFNLFSKKDFPFNYNMRSNNGFLEVFICDNYSTDKDKLNKEYDHRNKGKFYDEVNVPQMDLDTFLMLTGSSKEKFEEEIQKASEARVKSLLVIEAIAKKENIQASEEQLEEKYNELSKMYNMEVSKIKGLIAKENLEEEVIFNNTIKFLVENADFE
jgi:trigger factor